MTLRLERVRQRRTLKEVALQAGVHPTTLSLIESGRVNARSDELARIHAALGMTVEEVRDDRAR
jgi:transcriptional regulator with XRE-family HTH domain